MVKTVWTEKRLAQLFTTYNSRYWHGRLPSYAVHIDQPVSGEDWLGRCDSDKREILVDVEAHKNDREIRGTMLHEMAHVVAGPGRDGEWHGYKFWEQIESLLVQGAPITLGSPEAPHIRIMVGAIPKKFPLARTAMDRVESIHSRQILQLMKHYPAEQITSEEIVRKFEEAAMEMTWFQALRVVGDEYQLLDVGGRPRSTRAAGIIAEGKRKFNQMRREHLASEKLFKKFSSEKNY
jgi:hypothetical protein